MLPVPFILIILNLLRLLIQYRLDQKKAASIVILGFKGSGKTTLWQQLQGLLLDKKTTLMTENIDAFSFEYEGRKKKVLKSKDFSGSDDVLGSSDFEDQIIEILQEGTYIYYLIDLNKLTEKKFVEDTLARIEKITSIIRKKKIQNNKLGIKFVGTHLEKYLSDNPGKSETDALSDLISGLFSGRGKYNKDDKFMVAELSDRKYIDQFYKQIMG